MLLQQQFEAAILRLHRKPATWKGVFKSRSEGFVRPDLSDGLKGSGEVAAKAASDPAFMAQVVADPLIGTPRQGAIPIMVGGELIGAFAVSGAPGGDKDEPCSVAGLAKIQDRLK